MQAELIDGRVISASLREEIAAAIVELKAKGVTPGLGVIIVGEDPASLSYVKGKEKACREIGMMSRERHLPAAASEGDLLAEVRAMNEDPAIHGILVQLPLPKHIDEHRIIAAISPEKDVDGFTPINLGKMMIGERSFIPCTPHGVIMLLKKTGIPTNGAHAVIIGRSNIVGKPLAFLMAQKDVNSTVTVCHTGTKDLARHVRDADIVIACAGRPGLVTADMIKPGAIVIDVGVNRIDDPDSPRGFRLAGDVDFEGARAVAKAITPVPGGVGPMTITMLLYNTVESARFGLAKARE